LKFAPADFRLIQANSQRARKAVFHARRYKRIRFTSTQHPQQLHLNLNKRSITMATPRNPSGQSANRNTIATPFGIMRELVFWPLLVFGALGFSVFFGASHYVILAAFFLSALIVITTDGNQRLAACWVTLVFALVNVWHIHNPSPEMIAQPQFWFANRLLYAVGLAFWLQPICGKAFETEKGRERAIVVGVLLLFVAFIMYWLSRPSDLVRTVQCLELVASTCTFKEPSQSWYLPETLYDDVCVGIAAGLLYGALAARTKQKAAQQPKRS
jgi:hypothetical protein